MEQTQQALDSRQLVEVEVDITMEIQDWLVVLVVAVMLKVHRHQVVVLVTNHLRQVVVSVMLVAQQELAVIMVLVVAAVALALLVVVLFLVQLQTVMVAQVKICQHSLEHLLVSQDGSLVVVVDTEMIEWWLG
jgi:hypothetical protein